MGTFHEGKHRWHGITLVVDTSGSEVYIGRCDDMTDDVVHLLDVGVHDETTGTTKLTFIERALAVGVWPHHPRLTLALDSVTTIKPLADYAST